MVQCATLKTANDTAYSKNKKRQISTQKLLSLQGSTVADKPARRAASRQTAKFQNGHVTVTTPI